MIVFLFCHYATLLYYTVRGKSPQEGAATSINCAVNPELNSQQARHYADCRETPSSTAARYLRLR